MQRAQEVADTLARFKHEVALAAEDGRTGRPLPCKVLTELEDKGERREPVCAAVVAQAHARVHVCCVRTAWCCCDAGVDGVASACCMPSPKQQSARWTRRCRVCA
jgi:hypothetical protein